MEESVEWGVIVIFLGGVLDSSVVANPTDNSYICVALSDSSLYPCSSMGRGLF